MPEPLFKIQKLPDATIPWSIQALTVFTSWLRTNCCILKAISIMGPSTCSVVNRGTCEESLPTPTTSRAGIPHGTKKHEIFVNKISLPCSQQVGTKVVLVFAKFFGLSTGNLRQWTTRVYRWASHYIEPECIGYWWISPIAMLNILQGTSQEGCCVSQWAKGPACRDGWFLPWSYNL